MTRLAAMLALVAVLSGCATQKQISKEEAVARYGAIFSQGLAGKDKLSPTITYNIHLLTDSEVEELRSGFPYFDVPKLTSYAEQGYVTAQFGLFLHHYRGIPTAPATRLGVPSVTVDVCTAANWLHRASRSETPIGAAFLWMATIYSMGEGVPRDMDESIYWYLTWLKSHNVELSTAPIAEINPQFPKRSVALAIRDVEKWHAAERARPLLNLQPCPSPSVTEGRRNRSQTRKELGLDD